MLLPCDLSWTYFPAKVIGCSNLANAGVPLRVSRKNLPLRLSSVFSRISLVRLFPPPFGGRKINPKGRKQAEKREKMIEAKKEKLSIEKLKEIKMSQYNKAMQKENEAFIEEFVSNAKIKLNAGI